MPIVSFKPFTLPVAGMLLLFSSVLSAQALPDDMPAPNPFDSEHSIPKLASIAQQAYAGGDYQRFTHAMERLVGLRPYNGDFMYQLAAGYSLLDKKAEAYQVMMIMTQQGLTYTFPGNDDFDNVSTFQVYDYVVENAKVNSAPFGEVELFTAIDAPLVDSIAWDEQGQRALMGSVKTGHIHQVDAGGRSRVFFDNAKHALWGVMGLQVDAERNLVWVATANVPHFDGFAPVNGGRSALYGIDLNSATIRHRAMVPVDGLPHVIARLAIAPDGRVFAADAATPSVWVYDPDAESLERFMAAPGFTSLRGLAFDSAGEWLYLADYEKGLYAVDMAAKKAHFVAKGDLLNLGGIDGLLYTDGTLIAIQSMNLPHRVMRFAINGRQIGKIQPLVANLPQLDRPTVGTLRSGKEMLLIADSAWDAFDETGQAIAGAQSDIPVIKVDIEGPWLSNATPQPIQMIK